MGSRRDVAYLPGDEEALSEWTHRMELLRPWLAPYKRRFSVLDLGAGDGQISRAIAREYDAVMTVVEMNAGDTEEYGLHHYQDVPRIMVLRHRMTAEDLVRLNSCEYFDVVLCFNFLHHMGEDWLAAANVVLGMGRYAFIQIPYHNAGACGNDLLPAMHQWAAERRLRLIGETVQFPLHAPRPLWVHHNADDKILTRTSLLDKDGQPQRISAIPMMVEAALESCNGLRLDRSPRPWIQGINLWNWLALGGVWPERERVLELLDTVEPRAHGDVQPWNFILDGDNVHLIDGGEGWLRDDRAALGETIRRVREYQPRERPAEIR